MILEIELPLLRGIESGYVFKLKELLSVISASVPFTPNISKLGEKLTINRSTILSYLHYFQEVRLTNNLFKEANGISKLQKPQKIYLENTNLMQILSPSNVNIGNVRETFFANQVGFRHNLLYSHKGDFLVDKKYTFEIGGKGKNKEGRAKSAGKGKLSNRGADRMPYGLIGGKNRTPDGQKICFDFNLPSGCSRDVAAGKCSNGMHSCCGCFNTAHNFQTCTN
jgi:predicted AAA+ superfamily ATPase